MKSQAFRLMNKYNEYLRPHNGLAFIAFRMYVVSYVRNQFWRLRSGIRLWTYACAFMYYYYLCDCDTRADARRREVAAVGVCNVCKRPNTILWAMLTTSTIQTQNRICCSMFMFTSLEFFIQKLLFFSHFLIFVYFSRIVNNNINNNQ